MSLAHNPDLAAPDWITGWTALSRLDVSHTGLRALPPGLGRLPDLTAVYAAGNRLTALPRSLAGATRLAVLDLADNPGLLDPPPSVTGAGAGQVVAYFKALSRGETRQWTSKMLIVGQAAVGKTSLSKRLRGLPYDPLESQTHGVHVDTLDLPHPDLPGTSMGLAAWDFGGQLEYRATQRFYLSDRSLFVLVWRTRLGWRADGGRIQAWLGALASAAPNAPVLIVATHCDESVDDLDAAALKREFPSVVRAMRVDSASGTGIGELRGEIIRLAAGLPLMGASWPSDWVNAAGALLRLGAPAADPEPGAVRDAVADAVSDAVPDAEPDGGAHEDRDGAAGSRTAADFGNGHGDGRTADDERPSADLSACEPEPRYTDLAATHRVLRRAGVADPDERDQLLAALHDRGQILHFPRDPRLRDFVVLQPTWVDTMITRVLDDQAVADQGGVLSRSRLAELWPGLPIGVADKLAELMERFDLAYPIDAPEHDAVALVVERLSTGRPQRLPDAWDDVLDLPGASELRLTYRLDSRQAGVPSWFIAREHRFTTDTAWSRGVLLQYRSGPGQAWALLEDDDSAQPAISLTVRGTQPYRFYSLLDESFTGILRDRYPGLPYRRLVPCPCVTPHRLACTHEYDLDDVAAASSASELLHCPKSFAELDPDPLLTGVRAREPETVRLSRMERKLDRIVSGTARAADEQLLVYEAIRDLMQHRDEQGTHCPSIFTVTPLPPRGPLQRLRHLMTRDSSYRLQLYCEFPDAPHPLPDGAGVYELHEIPPWLHNYAPYLAPLIKVLRIGLPLLGPLGGILNETVAKAAQEELEAADDLIGDLAERATGRRAYPGRLPDGLRTASATAPLRPPARSDADFRELHRELTRIDSDFGGLRERELPESHGIVYLCAEHRRQLHYPARRPA